ncbi:unnamed protein product [Cylicostephanus goldi]|uniref:Uncharacterized protein n=1 Tax=Cylicostephanus goldi TaxID=71465 RepID=A0A3P6T3X0_CYLGO|nr:unnamed protein product [Cylicostephanus goldi]
MPATITAFSAWSWTKQTGIRATPDAIISVRHRASVPHSIFIGTVFFGCLMHCEDDLGEPDAFHDSEECVVSWFTRDELRSFDKEEFFEHHRDIFLLYDGWLNSNAGQDIASTKDGWLHSSLFFFSDV